MSHYHFTESVVEEAALEWLAETGYTVIGGPEIGPGAAQAERSSYRDVVLLGRLRAALTRLNPHLPAAAIEEAVAKLTRAESPNSAVNNHNFHKLLINGVEVSYQSDGRTVHDLARVVDFSEAGCVSNNDWLAVNQFSVQRVGERTQANATPGRDGAVAGTRRPDIVLFVNGLPLAVIELKNAADEEATVEQAYKQLQTYKKQIPDLFLYNEALAIADGADARMGTLTGSLTWFKPWKTIDGERLETERSALEVLIRGAFAPERFLDLVRHFVVFEENRGEVSKKMAAYHQYHAANKAVASTVAAVQGDGRAGTIWHTQGSGKSLTMLFYAGKIILHPAMHNPTLVVLTDRNDLDDQLYTNTFAPGHELLRQTPVHASDREDLREKLRVASGGVIFTTIQKFSPEAGASANPTLSERANIVFIVDEAHRTQYGFEARYVQVERDGQQVVETRYGLAKYMRDALPHASFIGFTGTPISQTDRNIRSVFGEYVDVYDIQQAVKDQATVPIYYEPRYARMKLDARYVPRIDPDFEEVMEGEEEAQVERVGSKWSQIAAIVSDPERVRLIAQDIVDHYGERDRALAGKAMIVGMSRALCVALHDELVKLRPDWYHPDDDKGALKVVMTGSAADEAAWGEHIRTTRRRRALADRFREELRNDGTDFKVVIVRDMWLTGFDAPALHTLYVDKPMKGLNLMQAIARVNRVYPDKEGGLVVAYLPLQSQLQEALGDYTQGDRTLTGIFQEQAAQVMEEKYEVVRALFHGFDYTPFFGDRPTQRLTILAQAVNFILEGREVLRQRYVDSVTALSRAYALATPHPSALAIRDEVAFFQAVKGPLVKSLTSGITPTGRTPQELERKVQAIVDRAVAPDGIVDLLEVAGLQRPDISILSAEFLAEVTALPQRNVAVELLRRLIDDEVRAQRRTNLVQSRLFSDRLQDALSRYNRRQVSALEMLDILLGIARDIQAAQTVGDELGLSQEEQAFYDALAANHSAVEVMGDVQLAFIARELLQQVRRNVSIDWTLQESARARIRILVKRILRRYGYPPDLQDSATKTVVEQAELLAADWAE